jgi:hypothetical protein
VDAAVTKGYSSSPTALIPEVVLLSWVSVSGAPELDEDTSTGCGRLAKLESWRVPCGRFEVPGERVKVGTGIDGFDEELYPDAS